MSDLQLPDRLTQLRSRWEADPASRIFLQLAEEYRHLGRLHEALAVLETGLKEHPGYLSALVAKGRCLLELGNAEPAREVLERVVRQDATQAVANKLLVRAYVETGQTEKARERLDLYSLLHDGDPEIEELRGRIRRLDEGEGRGEPRPPAPTAVPPPPPVAAAPVRPAPPADSAENDSFSLPPVKRPSPPVPATPVLAIAGSGEEEVFHLDKPLARRPAVQDVFELPGLAVAAIQVTSTAAAVMEPEPAAAAPALTPAVIPPPPDDNEPEPTPEGEPFPGLVSRAVRQRYLAGLSAGGLFPAIEAPAAAPRAVPPPALRESVVAPEAAPPAVPPAPPAQAVAPPASPPAEDIAPGEIFPLRSIGEAVEAELRRAAPEPIPVSPEPEPLVSPAPEPEPELFVDAADIAAPAAQAPVEVPEPAEEPEAATVTLGDLYLRQGHLAEAEGIFREVLRREPGNAAAQTGLSRVAASREEPAVTPSPRPPRSTTPFDPVLAAGAAGAMDVRSRKVLMLNRYLQRIRRGSHPDVP